MFSIIWESRLFDIKSYISEIYMFLNKKLNRDITLYIFKILYIPSFTHTKCLNLHFEQRNYMTYWYLCDNNKMYISNQFYPFCNQLH